MNDDHTTKPAPVRIPADVEREDRLLAGLTARQLAILTVTAAALYGVWTVVRDSLSVGVFAAIAVPVVAIAATLALGRRDGLGLDRWVVAALAQRFSRRRRIGAPEGVPRVPGWVRHGLVSDTSDGDVPEHLYGGAPAREAPLPVDGVSEAGALELGRDGIAVVAAVSSVNFALRSAAEQDALIATFGRYLHALTAPVQVVVRTRRLSLAEPIARVRAHADTLGGSALGAAALDHAEFLERLADRDGLLERQVFLVIREPLPAAARTRRRMADQTVDAARRVAEGRLVHAVEEASALLAPAGITVRPLDPEQATAVLAASGDPDSTIAPGARLAPYGSVITGSADDAGWPE